MSRPLGILLFGLLAVAWVLMWLFSAITISGVMGNSFPVLLVYIGMAFLPPTLLYILLFKAMPRILDRVRRTGPRG